MNEKGHVLFDNLTWNRLQTNPVVTVPKNRTEQGVDDLDDDDDSDVNKDTV